MADQAACFLRCSFFLFFFKSVQREFQCKVHQFIKRNTFLLRDHRTTFYEIFAQSQVFQHIFLGRYCKCVFAAHKIISLSVCNFNMKIKSNICIKRYTKICMEICIIYDIIISEIVIWVLGILNLLTRERVTIGDSECRYIERIYNLI